MGVIQKLEAELAVDALSLCPEAAVVPLPIPRMRAAHVSAVTGLVAEHRFMAEALLHGYERVWVPAIDTGTDFLVDDVSVQVKGACRTSQGQYVFAHPKRGLAARVVAFHGVDDDAWWIVPWDELSEWPGRMVTLSLASPRLDGRGRPRSRWAHLYSRRAAWQVIRDQGLSA